MNKLVCVKIIIVSLIGENRRKIGTVFFMYHFFLCQSFHYLIKIRFNRLNPLCNQNTLFQAFIIHSKSTFCFRLFNLSLQRMEGTKSKKRRDARASLSNQYMVWILPLALSKSGKWSKRNYASSQPVFASSPVYKKLCSIVLIVWHIGKCKKILLPVRRRGKFHMLFKKSGKI